MSRSGGDEVRGVRARDARRDHSGHRDGAILGHALRDHSSLAGLDLRVNFGLDAVVGELDKRVAEAADERAAEAAVEELGDARDRRARA